MHPPAPPLGSGRGEKSRASRVAIPLARRNRPSTATPANARNRSVSGVGHASASGPDVFGRSRVPEGRVGLFIKLHHTVADGAAGVAALAVFLGTSPDETPPISSDWNPEPAPTRIELIQDNLRDHWERLRRTIRALLHPVALLRRIRMAAAEVRRILGEAKAPKTSLNRRIGDRRRLALVRSELSTFKEAAHSVGGTVNDVLLDVVAGGLRDLLTGRGGRLATFCLAPSSPSPVGSTPNRATRRSAECWSRSPSAYPTPATDWRQSRPKPR